MRTGIRDLGRVVFVAALLAGGCNNFLPGGFSNGTGGAAAVSSAGGAPGMVVDAGAGIGGSLGTGGIHGVDASTNVPICGGIAPSSALIANFDDFTNHTFGVYGVDPVVGQTTTQPPLLRQDFTQGSWHVYGTVPQIATSFALFWNCPSLTLGACALDASQYLGIQFTISGTLFGPTNTLGFRIGRAEDELALGAQGCGTCVPADGGSGGGCQDPTTTINLRPVQTPQQVRVTWMQLTGGQPVDGVVPHAITAIGWTFPAALSTTDAAASYDVDITIDDISFIPDIGP